jgi:choline-sulfatase
MTSRNHLLSRREVLVSGAAAAATALTGCGDSPIPGPRAIRRPNILLLVSDQHRFDWVGRNPDIPVPTPHLDALAARGTDLTRAIVPSPVCGPSRSCLASGMEYENCTVARNRDVYDAALRPTFYKHLHDSGYHTMACGKIDLHKGPDGRRPDGKLHMEEWGFSDMLITGGKIGGDDEPYGFWLDSLDPPLKDIHNADFRERVAPRNLNWWGMTKATPIGDHAYKDNYTARTGLDLLDGVPEGSPWFLQVNFNGPHPPMDITERMEREYRGPDRVIEDFPQPYNYRGIDIRGRMPAPPSPFAPEHHVRIRQNYAAMIENIDRWIGLYEERLEERGELNDTIVIYTSDHGEMLGDHDHWGKSVPHEASWRVPLVMAGPGIAAGTRSGALVSLMDLAATSLDYAETGVPEEMQSRSLRPLLDSGRGEHREHVRSALNSNTAASGTFRVVQDHRYKLVDGFEEEPMLYEIEADPWEDENIAAAKPDVVARLEKLLV